MTEDEAKTKWCHATAYRTLYDDAARYPDNVAAAMNRCIASACMAWRKSVSLYDRRTNQIALPGDTPAESLEPRYNGHGYCGLAGAVQ